MSLPRVSPIKIEIELHPEETRRWWSVRSGGIYEDQLGADEALWTVVALMTGSGTGYLRTPEALTAWEAREGLKEPLAEGK